MSCCLLEFGRVQELRQVREFLFPKHKKAGPEEEKTQTGTAEVSLNMYVRSSLIMMVLLHCRCSVIYVCQ